MKRSSISFRLLAKVVGYPRPNVTWHQDGEVVKVCEALTLEHYEDGTVSLSLPFTDRSQCGEYTCEAHNRNGVASCLTQLIVVPQGMQISLYLVSMSF